jgi:hypothetical protein
MEAPAVTGEFKALHLPRGVIDKIYRINAVKSIPGLAGAKTKAGK